MKKNNLKALGFIEVLIAIVVVGITSAVFLTISGKAMKTLIQTERIEYMARVANDGINIAQEIANMQKSTGVLDNSYFPTESIYIGRCFIPVREEDGNDVNYYFTKIDDSDSFLMLSYDSLNETVRTSDIADEMVMYDNYFLVMCIDDIDTTGTKWAAVRFVVGDLGLAGKMTKDSDIKDIVYYSVIDL
jgi:hypothetical protein